MKLELLSAANFLTHLVRLAKRGVHEKTLAKFRENLIQVLRRRYRDHWFPEKPFKGSGYRCIRINGRMDPVIGCAGDKSKLSSTFLHSTFPSELTMWIDPLEVSYRIGENGSICVLYEYSEGGREWMPAFLRNNNNNCKLEPPVPQQPELTPLPTNTIPTCKDSLRMDYLLDPKKRVSIEQLAALVSDTTLESKTAWSEDRTVQQNAAARSLQVEPREMAASTSTVGEVLNANDRFKEDCCCQVLRKRFLSVLKKILYLTIRVGSSSGLNLTSSVL